MPPAVGFDLDMTLVDSRPGIARSLRALSADTGVAIDVPTVLSRLGPKLESELARWFPAAQVDAMAARYREHYWRECVGDGTIALPGAAASIDAVRARGGLVVTVTAKAEPHAWRCLDAVGLRADAVVGHVHGDEKRDAIRAHGIAIYVGDTVADMVAARDAGVRAVGVTTGMHRAPELSAAGATVVFGTLEAFPEWFRAQELT